MTTIESTPDIGVTLDAHVALVELRRPPHNFMDVAIVDALAGAFERLDALDDCRAVVLASQGKSFCAGANFAPPPADGEPPVTRGLVAEDLYRQAVRLFRFGKPVVAAVHGAAIGGGLGLAVSADFRVTCREAVFSANFARLGMHAGFGLSHTLPVLVGLQKASLLLYTGRRIHGDEAFAIGLADELVDASRVRDAALALAGEIAASAPLVVRSHRYSLRRGLAERVEVATEREAYEQRWQRMTEDHKEGVAAVAARRLPVFRGR